MTRYVDGDDGCCLLSTLASLADSPPPHHQVVWKWHPGDNSQEIFIISVDGTHCRINEPRKQPSSSWCPHKFKSAGLSYELAIAVHDSQLVWTNGPFKAGVSDIKIYKQANGLRSKMPPGKKGIADRGHPGVDESAIRNEFDTPAVKQSKNCVRARHETFNGRLKHFSILDERSRHGFQNHKQVFEACCVLLQYEMEGGHALFDA